MGRPLPAAREALDGPTPEQDECPKATNDPFLIACFWALWHGDGVHPWGLPPGETRLRRIGACEYNTFNAPGPHCTYGDGWSNHYADGMAMDFLIECDFGDKGRALRGVVGSAGKWPGPLSHHVGMNGGSGERAATYEREYSAVDATGTDASSYSLGQEFDAVPSSDCMIFFIRIYSHFLFACFFILAHCSTF